MRRLLLLPALWCACAQPAPEPPPVDAASYPVIEDPALAQLRWVLELANRPLDDFTDLEAANQRDLTAYRYAIAFTGYAMAAVQYHLWPAWAEVLQPAMNRLIEKLLRRPVWEYWAEVSRGVPTLEPALDRPYPEAHDPVGDKNVMYSGHLAHLSALYAMLYRDFRWDQPGSMTFEWSPDEIYRYDAGSLTEVLHRQMAQNREPGICCEPNAVFPECNQHPILAFRLRDATHRTSFFSISERFFDFFVRKGLTDPETGETAMLYLMKQDSTLSQSNPKYHNANDPLIAQLIEEGIITLESATANGWTGTFMHAWKPEFVEALYPVWKARHYTPTDDGAATLKDETWEPRVRYGFFAMLAAEMGDRDARDRLLAHADRHFPILRGDGTLHYHCPPVSTSPCTNLTDRLLLFARVLPRHGWLAIHEHPFGDDHFRSPRWSGIDWPRVLVRRAIWDPTREALVASFRPADPVPGAVTTVRAEGLDPRRSWRVLRDGAEILRAGRVDSLELEVPLDADHDVVVQALP
ncbi:hypothetical protein KBD49_10960 [Myxococcota bacterium]|nr:hypothetical protein [Myxococcota bacterium]